MIERDITDKQKEFMAQLGIPAKPGMTRNEARQVIELGLAAKCAKWVNSFQEKEEVFHKIQKVRCQIEVIRRIETPQHISRNHFTVVFQDGKRQAVNAGVIKKIKVLDTKGVS